MKIKETIDGIIRSFDIFDKMILAEKNPYQAKQKYIQVQFCSITDPIIIKNNIKLNVEVVDDNKFCSIYVYVENPLGLKGTKQYPNQYYNMFKSETPKWKDYTEHRKAFTNVEPLYISDYVHEIVKNTNLRDYRIDKLFDIQEMNGVLFSVCLWVFKEKYPHDLTNFYNILKQTSEHFHNLVISVDNQFYVDVGENKKKTKKIAINDERMKEILMPKSSKRKLQSSGEREVSSGVSLVDYSEYIKNYHGERFHTNDTSDIDYPKFLELYNIYIKPKRSEDYSKLQKLIRDDPEQNQIVSDVLTSLKGCTCPQYEKIIKEFEQAITICKLPDEMQYNLIMELYDKYVVSKNYESCKEFSEFLSKDDKYKPLIEQALHVLSKCSAYTNIVNEFRQIFTLCKMTDNQNYDKRPKSAFIK